jgi:hypothetical protein
MENEDFENEQDIEDKHAFEIDDAYDRMRDNSYEDLEKSVKNLIEYSKKIPYFKLHDNPVTLAKSIIDIVCEELLKT